MCIPTNLDSDSDFAIADALHDAEKMVGQLRIFHLMLDTNRNGQATIIDKPVVPTKEPLRPEE